MTGREAYEEDCRRMPAYHDGTPRTPWDRLPDYARHNWNRYPTLGAWRGGGSMTQLGAPMTDLRILAERCEKATGPDRELATEIALAVGWTLREVRRTGRSVGEQWRAPGTDRDSFFERQPPNFTASLDAAMSLVPEWCRWTMDSWTFGWSAGIWRPVNNDWLLTPSQDRQAKTPALALCAAALRTRDAQPGDNR